MGYGARQGTCTGVHDRLQARALALRGPDGPGILLVAADLCLITPTQALATRERVSAATGLPQEAILVSCSHTHSGPDTGAAEASRGEPLPAWAEPVFEGIVAAGVEAHATLRPARLGWGHAAARIGRNRRLEGGPLDPEILVLRVDEPSGTRLASLFIHACHGTVLGHDNLEVSADWAGVAAARIEEAHGGTALFLLGAHADIDPRTRAVMDLAIPGQSVGLGFEAVEVLGREVADAVLAALPGIQLHGDLGISSRSVRETLALHPGDVSDAEARTRLESQRLELARELRIEPDDFPRLSELYERVHRQVAPLPVEQAREHIARARLYLRDKTGPFFVGGQRRVEVETQLLRIGDAALLGLPLEPTTEVGLDWKARVRRRGLRGAVLGIANGWLRYLPHPRDLEDPLAHHRYEVLMSMFAPPACERLLDAGERLLDGGGSGQGT